MCVCVCVCERERERESAREREREVDVCDTGICVYACFCVCVTELSWGGDLGASEDTGVLVMVGVWEKAGKKREEGGREEQWREGG